MAFVCRYAFKQSFIYFPSLSLLRTLSLSHTPAKGHTLLTWSMACNRSGHLTGNPKLVWHPARSTPYWLETMVCNRSWHLPGNPKLVWHPVRLINKGGCVDLFVDTMHLKDLSLDLKAPFLPFFFFHLELICFALFFNNDKGQLFSNIYGTKWPLNPHSCTPSHIPSSLLSFVCVRIFHAYFLPLCIL